jgi:hypothetical protein
VFSIKEFLKTTAKKKELSSDKKPIALDRISFGINLCSDVFFRMLAFYAETGLYEDTCQP